ncbi:hypothetical protein GGE07_006116 [Sinorhizobium terangae]|nr:hypothetical protein [Sinorhizobium terangae]
MDRSTNDEGNEVILKEEDGAEFPFRNLGALRTVRFRQF